MSTCTWMTAEIPPRQCRWPGVFSSSGHGDHRWKCVFHHRLTGNAGPSETQLEGNRIVNDSHEWDGTPESYLALRLEGAQRVQPEPGGERKHHPRGGAAGLPKTVAELVSGVRISPEEEFLSSL